MRASWGVFSLFLAVLPNFAFGQTRVHSNRVRVSAATPFTAGCNGQQNGVVYSNGEVEPWIAVDPTNASHLVGVWQQDRWSTGGANGLLTGVSWDSGRTWTRTFAHFSRCSGGSPSNNGNFDRSSDPWVTFTPDGKVFQISYSFNQGNVNQAILVSRSLDGGMTWEEPVAVLHDTASGITDDKESITADPTDANYVYAVWDRLTGSSTGNPSDFHGPVWFSRTTDGGATWEAARAIYDPGPDTQTIGNQILVLPDGTLIDVFTLIRNAIATTANPSSIFVAVIRSTDHGETWTPAIIVSTSQAVGVSDVKTGAGIRSGGVLVSAAVDQVSGALYTVWQDARFSNGQRNGIAFSRSTDGGFNWSEPIQVNQAPNVQAFVPAVAVGQNGNVAVAYYDFRNDTEDRNVLLTSYWREVSPDGGLTWHEGLIGGPFDMTKAPIATGAGFFVGDYEGLVPYGNGFLSFFVTAESAAGDPTNVYAAASEAQPPPHLTQRVEVNRVRLRLEEETVPGAKTTVPRHSKQR
ncbi:MAG TPA: sialidase family protein [Bryobacteraceae bacterium]|nr:sialidase family protein [Bryobacteraceae bacterium]